MMTIRPSPVTFLIFAVIWLILCVPGIDAIRLGQWQGLLFILVGGVLTILPISRYCISWNADELIYRGLVSTRRIRLSEICKFDVSGPSLGKRFAPTLGLRIFTAASSTPFMTINIKPFARQDIERLVTMIKTVTATKKA